MEQPKKRGFRLSYLLLLVPFLGVLWVPFYNRAEPSLAGIPFFYWYQLVWIVLGALILLPAFLGDRK